MDRLTANGPLEGILPVALEGALLSPLAPAPLSELRGPADDLSEALGVPAVPEPGWVADYGDWRLLWLRPDGWLLIGQYEFEILQRVDAPFRLTDIGHALTGIRLTGPNARVLLAKGTPLDLRPHRFAIGQCAQTWCAGFRILIEARDDGFDVYVDAALALAFWHWIRDAAAEFERPT